MSGRELLDAWYLVAGVDEVTHHELRPFSLPGLGGVITRTSGGLRAWSAICPHMGADLRAGWIEDGQIVCPLHGMRFGADGRCDRTGVPSATALPIEERCGSVFVRAGASTSPAPQADRWPEESLVWAQARAFHVPVPWRTVLVNAFDLHHLRVVHHRALAREPIFESPSADRLRMCYATRVVGTGISDYLTAALAREPIDIWLTCVGGTVLIVEVDLGRTRTAAVVGVIPDGESSWLRISVGVSAGLFGHMRAAVARWLYVSFLRRDIPVLRGVTLQTRSLLPEDIPVQRLAAFLDARPAA